MKIEGNYFTNSATCAGTVYAAPGAPLDISVIKITGRYPEEGWAVNDTVYESAYIKQGSGSLLVKNEESVPLAVGTVVTVEPGKRFAWNGDMEVVMACSPQFDPKQYRMEVA